MTYDEFRKRLPLLTDEEIKKILPCLASSYTKEELIELAREHLRIGLEQIRNRWIEGSGKSEEEIRAWEAKYLEEILWEWEKEHET
jgi:hypothetical protein